MNGPTKEADLMDDTAQMATPPPQTDNAPNYEAGNGPLGVPTSEYATVIAARPCVAADPEFDPSTPKYIVTYQSGIKEAVPHG